MFIEELEKLPFMRQTGCSFKPSQFSDNNSDVAFAASFKMPDIDNYHYRQNFFSNSEEVFGYNLFTVGYCATADTWTFTPDSRVKNLIDNEINCIGVTINISTESISQAYYSISEIYTDCLMALYPPKKVKVYEVRNVYVMHEAATGKYKIGISRNLQQRLKALSYMCPTLTIVKSWKGTFKDETALHNLFSDKCITGEWFYLEGGDIDEIDNYFNSKSE